MILNAVRGPFAWRDRTAATTAVIRLALLPAVLAWLPGCTGGEAAESAEESDATRVSIKAEAPTTYRDACEIITAEDVAALVGEPMEAVSEEGPGETRCSYAAPGRHAVMHLVVHWQGGKEEWDSWGMGRQMAARVMQDPEVDVDSIIAGDPLSGVGDAAHYGDLLPSMVLVGDVLLEFQMMMFKDARSNFPVLAKKAVSRL